MTVPQTVPKGWSLTGKNGAMDGKIFSLEIANVSIGTDPTTCNIVYPANTLGIAQLHCRLIWKDDGWLVVSFGDSGTWLNDNLLKNGQAVPISPGDTLSLANSGNNFILKYNIILEPVSPPPPPPPPPTNERDTWENIKEKFFSFKGRLNRKPYLLRLTLVFFIECVDWAVLAYLNEIPANQLNNLGISIIIVLLFLWIVCCVSTFALDIRRFHDTDHSGWWVLTLFIPIVQIYGMYLLAFKKGTPGDNRFGPDPLS